MSYSICKFHTLPAAMFVVLDHEMLRRLCTVQEWAFRFLRFQEKRNAMVLCQETMQFIWYFPSLKV